MQIYASRSINTAQIQTVILSKKHKQMWSKYLIDYKNSDFVLLLILQIHCVSKKGPNFETV